MVKSIINPVGDPFDKVSDSPADLGLDADLSTFSLPANTTISTFGASLVDDADASAGRTTLGLVAGGSGDIWVEKAGDTMSGTLNMGSQDITAINDLFLNSTGIIDFGSGNIVLTHSSGALTMTGGDLTVDDNNAYFLVTDTGPADGNSGGNVYVRSDDGTIMTANQRLGGLLWQGYDGSGYSNGAEISADVDANWSNGSSYPTRLEFFTVPSGSTSQSLVMTLEANGNLTMEGGDIDMTQGDVINVSYLNGGTSTSNNIHIQANSATLGDAGVTGHIVIKNEMLFDETFQIDHDGTGFAIWEFRNLQSTGTWTVQSGALIGDATVVHANATLKYSTAMLVAASATFDARMVFQPTASLTDGASTEWRGFFSFPTFRPNLSTAVTATSQMVGYATVVNVDKQSGSHASSNAVLSTATGFRGAVATLNANASITTGRVFHATEGTATGSITTLVGLDIDDLTAGSTNISIRSSGSNLHMRHAGSITVGATSAPSYDLHLRRGANARSALAIARSTTLPTSPTSNTEGVFSIYKGSTNTYALFTFNDGGTVRYKYMPLNGTSVTWTHSTTAPA